MMLIGQFWTVAGRRRTESEEPPGDDEYEEIITSDENNIRTTDGHIVRARKTS